MKGIQMNKTENMASYITGITQVRYDLREVEDIVHGSELVRTTLNGVTNPWDLCVEYIIARENIPTWGHLWDDFIQDKT